MSALFFHILHSQNPINSRNPTQSMWLCTSYIAYKYIHKTRRLHIQALCFGQQAKHECKTWIKCSIMFRNYPNSFCPYMISWSVHLLLLCFTFFDNNNKITYKNVLNMSKLGQALNKFHHGNNTCQSQEHFNITKQLQTYFNYVMGCLFIKHLITTILYYLKIHFASENIEIQCVFILPRIFKAFCSKNSPSLHYANVI
jgi:hypothetical protein